MTTTLRTDWTEEEIDRLWDTPLLQLIYDAQNVHRRYFLPNKVQISTLLSIKTGGCPENCAYCPQSAHFKTNTTKEPLWDIDRVEEAAKAAKEKGAGRFCLGAAWRQPPKKGFEAVLEMIKRINALGMESCVTLGMLTQDQAQSLKDVGLDYYNHNLDTSPEYYPQITTTRTYEERLTTLAHVREAGINVCCGGIVGLGESRRDRIRFLQQLANLPQHPQSVPINHLSHVVGTPLEKTTPLESFEFIRTIAVARLMMPESVIRLSAGREKMSDETQALCFLAGANSIFYGEKLFLTPNPTLNNDILLFEKLGLESINSPHSREGMD